MPGINIQVYERDNNKPFVNITSRTGLLIALQAEVLEYETLTARFELWPAVTRFEFTKFLDEIGCDYVEL